MSNAMMPNAQCPNITTIWDSLPACQKLLNCGYQLGSLLQSTVRNRYRSVLLSFDRFYRPDYLM